MSLAIGQVSQGVGSRSLETRRWSWSACSQRARKSFQPQEGKALPIRNLNHFRGLGQLLCEIACCE